MLAVLVADIAAAEGLDVGLAVQLAIVHDLPETYCGDTCTARRLSEEEQAAKDAGEALSVARLQAELGHCWATTMIGVYEAQTTAEARLVKVVDKIMPKLTHALDGGLSLAKIGMSADEAEAEHAAQGEHLRRHAPGLGLAHTLFDLACERSVAVRRAGEGGGR